MAHTFEEERKLTAPSRIIVAALRAGCSPARAEERLREAWPDLYAEGVAEAFALAIDRLVREAADRPIHHELRRP